MPLTEMLLKACKGEPFAEELAFVCKFYGGDLSKAQLETQLPLLQALCSNSSLVEPTVADLAEVLGGLSCAQRVAFSAVFTAMKLLLVMPATNSTSERSFSAERRIKTFLRTTMTQEWLNSLMTLHVHKERTDNLKL